MKKIILGVMFLIYAFLFALNKFDIPLSANKKDELYLQIEEFAEKNYIAPVDATFDKIWKRIPGLNGRKVNVTLSYENMKNEQVFDEQKIVYEEIPIANNFYDLKLGPLYKGNPGKNTVSFIINVAWGEEYLEDLLAILTKYNAVGNFFIEGNWATNNASMVMNIYEQGHLVGNHSYSHKDFAKIDKVTMRKEINDTNNVLSSLTLEKITYFGPPSGSFTDEVLNVLNEVNMNMVMWSIDTIDWQNPSVQMIEDRVLSKITAGSIILMHPTENTVKALENILYETTKRGLSIVSLDELISPKRMMN